MILHALYFENLGGIGPIDGKIAKVVSAAWGNLARFETQMKTTALGIGGETGWVVLGWDLRAAQPVLPCLGHNNQSAAATVPLLLLDAYERAYALDFDANLKGYVEAVFANVNWDVVNRQLEAVAHA